MTKNMTYNRGQTPTEIAWIIGTIATALIGAWGISGQKVAVLEQRVTTNESTIKEMGADIKFIRDAVTSLVAKQEVVNKLPTKR